MLLKNKFFLCNRGDRVHVKKYIKIDQNNNKKLRN